MTQEEKAKAYDEALERARERIWTEPQDHTDAILKDIFPELAESEDEMIRSAMIRGFNSMIANQPVATFAGEPIKDILAYLEKQKEQKNAEQNSESGDSEKPNNHAEWSEEDEEHRQNCLKVIKMKLDEKPYPYYEDYLWFKSLPERFNLQPKQELSEEDEERLDSIIESYKELLKDYKACHDVDYIPYNSDTVIRNVVDDVNFLKDIRTRPHWKPTEEQMRVFLKATPVNLMPDELSVYHSLYEELKKL